MSRSLETSSTTFLAKIMSNIEDPVLLLERHLYGHPSAGLLWDRQFEESLLERGWEKLPIWECMFVHRKQGFFRQKMWMPSQWLEISRIWFLCEKRWWSMWILTNPHHFLTMSTWDVLGVNANRMKIFLNKKRWCSNDVFLLEQPKITRMWKTSRKDGCVVLRHGRTCSKMRWTILWTGKQESEATVQSFKSLLGWSSV